MTLPDLLDELAREEPPLRVDADAAWAAGRARRTRRLPRALVAAAAVLGLLALVVPLVPLPAPGYARPVTAASHPARLALPWGPVSALPERPGALAALVLWQPRTWADRLSGLLPGERQEARSSGPRLHAVSPGGRVWLVPRDRDLATSTLSPDGRLLAGLRVGGREYVVRDLVTGEEVVVQGVAGRTAGVPGAARVPEDQQPRWSPDGRQVAYPAGHALVLDVRAGAFLRVPPSGTLVGWRSPRELLWLDGTAVVTTDLQGREQARVPLLPAPADPSAWSATTTADGSELVLPDGSGLRWYDLRTGRSRAEATYPRTGGGVCGLGPYAVAGSRDVVVTSVDDGGAARSSRLGEEPGPVASIEPVACPVWASAALGGRAVDGAGSGQRLAGGALAAAGVVAVLLLLRRVFRADPPAGSPPHV